MTRKAEIEDVLKPWYEAPDIDYDAMSDTEFDVICTQARQIKVLCMRWYLAGLERAIGEMTRKIDGQHLYATRAELIAHLKSIHAPH